MKTIFVVGDRFHEFAKNANVVTASALLVALRQPFVADLGEGVLYSRGQGVQPEQALAILKEAELQHRLSLFPEWSRHPEKAPTRQTHKRHPENALVSSPRRIDASTFEGDLLIDDRHEMMRDHVSGQHIPGILLIEAARQFSMTVTEAFFVEQESAFVVSVINSSFLQFTFPLPATIRYELHEKRVDDPAKKLFHATNDIQQSGRSTVKVEVKFTVFPRALMESSEAKRAKQATESANGLSPLPERPARPG